MRVPATKNTPPTTTIADAMMKSIAWGLWPFSSPSKGPKTTNRTPISLRNSALMSRPGWGMCILYVSNITVHQYAFIEVSLLRPGVVGLAVADLVVAVDLDLDVAVSVGGAAWFGIVAEAVLRAEVAVNAFEDAVEFLELIGIEHGAAHRIGDGVERVLAGSVAPTFVC